MKPPWDSVYVVHLLKEVELNQGSIAGLSFRPEGNIISSGHAVSEPA